MSLITPKRLRAETIRENAEEFRNKYVNPPELIPVPIEEIIEFKLNIDIIPIFGLKQLIDIEGFITSDLKSIYIDNHAYNDDRFLKRVRFTFAHEIGHLILHREELSKLEFSNYKEWMIRI